MERGKATELANSWYELAEGREELAPAYGQVKGFLMNILPDDVDAGAGALVDGQPAVLALADKAFFLATFQKSDGTRLLTPAVERIALEPSPPSHHIRDGWRDETAGGSASGLAAHVRAWTLTWPGGRAVSFESVVGRSVGFETGPDDAEAFGRVLAARLGWTVPD